MIPEFTRHPKKPRQYPERMEQKKVVEFLWQQKEFGHVIEYTATAQATYAGWNQISINSQLGVRKGLPDLIIILPPRNESGNRLVFIEMKHPGISSLSAEQRVWIESLHGSAGPNVFAWVSYSAKDAIQKLTQLIGDIDCPKSEESFEQFLNQPST